MRVFVTVGSTLFEALVEGATSDAVLSALASQGFSEMTVQHGKGAAPASPAASLGITVHSLAYAPSLHDLFASADLIISHAGSGSIIEALRLNKRLIVVINELLMDNHQQELALAMEREGYLRAATCGTLLKVVQDLPHARFKPFPPPTHGAMQGILDDYFGGGAK